MTSTYDSYLSKDMTKINSLIEQLPDKYTDKRRRGYVKELKYDLKWNMKHYFNNPYITYDMACLLLASAYGNIEDFNKILKYVSDQKASNDMLHGVSYSNNVAIAKVIISLWPPRSSRYFSELSIQIRRACRYGNLDILKFYVEYLIEHKINIEPSHCLDDENDDVLYNACITGHMHIVSYLESIQDEKIGIVMDWNRGLKGACINHNGSRCDQDLELVGYLINKGANNLTNGFKIACEEDNLPLIKYLIDITNESNYSTDTYRLGSKSFNIDHSNSLFADRAKIKYGLGAELLYLACFRHAANIIDFLLEKVVFSTEELNTAMRYGFYRAYDGHLYSGDYVDFLPMAKKLIKLGANNLSKFMDHEIQGMYPLQDEDLTDLYSEGIDLKAQGFTDIDIKYIKCLCELAVLNKKVNDLKGT